MNSATMLASPSSLTARPFTPARAAGRVQCRQRTTIVAQANSQRGHKRALAAGLALVASVPLVFSGDAQAFVGNTAKDFSEKVDRYTPSPSDIKDVASTKVEQATPDVPLPGQNQKGKEAQAIGKAPAQSGPGAADQLPVPEAVPSKGSLAQAGKARRDGGGVAGGEFSIKDSQ